MGQNLQVTLRNGDDKEVEAKNQLERIVNTYDKLISKWLFTKRIVIDKNGIPFSYPFLTLNCNYLDNDLKQLSNFLHEEFHWFVETMPVQEKNAINEFKKVFPVVPVKGGEGAKDEYSTYLHLIVCDLEFQSMTKLIGEESARQVLTEWNHYTWIYKTVIENKNIREINATNGFVIP
jgi:hypothetical protein